MIPELFSGTRQPFKGCVDFVTYNVSYNSLNYSVLNVYFHATKACKSNIIYTLINLYM